MKNLRKVAKRIAQFSAEVNKLGSIPDGYDIITLNQGLVERAAAEPTQILMHKEGSVQQIYKSLKKAK